MRLIVCVLVVAFSSAALAQEPEPGKDAVAEAIKQLAAKDAELATAKAQLAKAQALQMTSEQQRSSAIESFRQLFTLARESAAAEACESVGGRFSVTVDGNKVSPACQVKARKPKAKGQ